MESAPQPLQPAYAILGFTSAILDGIENKTERAYTGWPGRLYLIETDGRVAFKTAPGPYGFSTPGLEHALEQVTRTKN